MSVPTYQQILAEQYEESARDLLLQQQESDNVNEEIDPHNSSTQIGTTLENPEEFQQFQGNRGSEDHLIVPKTFTDTGVTSVRYNKDVQKNIIVIDSRFRAYAIPGIPTLPSNLTTSVYINPVAQSLAQTELTSLSSNFSFRFQKLNRNVISMSLTSLNLPNTFYNVQDVRFNDYIYVAQGLCSETTSYTKIKLLTVDTSLTLGCPSSNQGNGAVNGYYYSNTSIINGLNNALKMNIPNSERMFSDDLSFSYSNGFCQVSNNSTNNYTFSFPRYNASLSSYQIFPPLGKMLGFNQFNYDIYPTSSSPFQYKFECAQISACKCYGTMSGEDPIDMNADPYIYVSIADWANVEHATVNDTYFTAFAHIPITTPKGQLIYDNLVNNTTTKKYYFPQPTNIQQLEIKLLDMTGQKLIMPNTNWLMTLEAEEVLSQSLYEKMREL